MNGRNRKIARAMTPAILAAATLLAAAGAITMTAAINLNGPRVGDIITFGTSHDAPAAYDVRLLVNRVGQFACVLDVDTLLHNGGSMILEARVPGTSRAFFLHWAGERTSSDAADCGAAADLVVDRRDIDILSVAAGGYGIGLKMTRVSNMSSMPL